MNRIRLFFLLRKNTKLSEKRHPMFEANQYGKFFGYLMVSILAIEFIALGTFLGWLAAKEDVPALLFYGMPIILIFDFGMRFMTQQTPLMLVKPYLLTPISKYAAIDCFLVKQVLDAGNLFWMVRRCVNMGRHRHAHLVSPDDSRQQPMVPAGKDAGQPEHVVVDTAWRVLWRSTATALHPP